MGAAQSDGNQSKGDIFTRLRDRLMTADQAKAKELGGVFLFNVIKDQNVNSWTMDLNQVTVYEGEPEGDPDVTFTLTEANLKQLVFGREPAKAVLAAGRCSVTGDIMRAMKLEPYIKLE